MSQGKKSGFKEVDTYLLIAGLRLTIIGINFATDTTQPLSDQKGNPDGLLFTLRSFISLMMLEAWA